MSLENLSTRVNYYGTHTKARMETDKLRSLKAALKNSYQRQTAILQDGREFFCLINPDKLKNDYDDKIISIPFEDICLNSPRVGKTSQGIVPIGMKAGDTFTWKENNTHWIVSLQRLQETAYFKASIRQCDYEVELDNGSKYWIYFKGPTQQGLEWKSKNNIVWNGLNYTAMITITKNEETEDFFHRFTKIKVCGKPWKVGAIDSLSTEGIIDVYLEEDFTNSIQDEIDELNKNKVPEPPIPEDIPYIEGDLKIYPYDIKTYKIKNAYDGKWFIESNKVRIVAQNSEQITIEVLTGKSYIFTIVYKRDNEDDITQEIEILSF